ncbi:monooxygenase [Penicillium sp. IBT 16267x]|nr:monooxygenase [Penicillium sp. IBT 16267x]
MATTETKSFSHNGYPPRADLRKMMDQQPLPTLAPGLIDPASMEGYEATNQAQAVLNILNTALTVDDAKILESCFYADQAYWKDQLSLTYHLRTFSTPGIIAAGLLETAKLRGISKGIEVDGVAMFLPATPVLQFIDCPLLFRTSSPAATCRGKMILLPVIEKGYNQVVWKIWVLSTRLESLELQSEDELLLHSPGRQLDNAENFETDVFIIGGGNAGVALSARLKALGVDSVLAEQNPRVGDNWALRYDCMKFHVPTSLCDLPYMGKTTAIMIIFGFLDLASQVRQYVETFNLNMVNSAKIQFAQYDETTKRWKIDFQTPLGQRTAVSKQLVLATGIGSQKANLPTIADKEIYRGTSIHSARYKNATALKEQGANVSKSPTKLHVRLSLSRHRP